MVIGGFKHEQVEIGKLSALGAPGGVPAVRLALERLLGSADLRPPGMPPSTVLVVRRMSDPQPGQIASRLAAIHVRSDWERRARQQLAAQYHSAARPALGIVPESAGAVSFADESEVLACLACDIYQGVALQQWWWRSVLRSLWGNRAITSQTELMDALAQQMMRRAQYLPGAMARLQQWGEAAHCVQSLTSTQAEQILQALLWVYHLPDLPDRSARVAMPAMAQRPPWDPSLTPPFLGREQATLLGLSLDLHTRPHEVQTQPYRRTLHTWWQSAGSDLVPDSLATSKRSSAQPDNAPSDPSRPTSGEATAQVAPDNIARSVDAVEPKLARETLSEKGTSPHPPLHANLQPSQKPAQNSTETEPWIEAKSGSSIDQTPHTAHSLPKQTDSQGQPEAQTSPPTDLKSDAPFNVQSNAQYDGQPDAQLHAERDEQVEQESYGDVIWEPSPWPADGMCTELGGLLYLINLMVSLDLPDCFEEDWRLTSRVGPWGLLEALGRELLGDAIAGLEDDPLWTALAQLDGRLPGQPPGYRLPRSRPRHWPSFRLPTVWLESLPHSAQDQVAQLPSRLARRQFQGIYAPLLARWLALTLPFIVYRLGQALHLPDATTLADALLRVPGNLYITSSHVDWVTPMENISLAVRLAGLDRNPGWLPDFGRVVYFHFE